MSDVKAGLRKESLRKLEKQLKSPDSVPKARQRIVQFIQRECSKKHVLQYEHLLWKSFYRLVKGSKKGSSSAPQSEALAEAIEMYASEVLRQLPSHCHVRLRHTVLTRLGDLHRYAAETPVGFARTQRHYDEAEAFYQRAVQLLPNVGSPWNQMAVLAKKRGHRLRRLYAYVRGAGAVEPFDAAKENLFALLRRSLKVAQNAEPGNLKKSKNSWLFFQAFVGAVVLGDPAAEQRCQQCCISLAPMVQGLTAEQMEMLTACLVYALNCHWNTESFDGHFTLGVLSVACLLLDASKTELAVLPAIHLLFDYLSLHPAVLDVPLEWESEKQTLRNFWELVGNWLNTLSLVEFGDTNDDADAAHLQEEERLLGFAPLQAKYSRGLTCVLSGHSANEKRLRSIVGVVQQLASKTYCMLLWNAKSGKFALKHDTTRVEEEEASARRSSTASSAATTRRKKRSISEAAAPRIGQPSTPFSWVLKRPKISTTGAVASSSGALASSKSPGASKKGTPLEELPPTAKESPSF